MNIIIELSKDRKLIDGYKWKKRDVLSFKKVIEITQNRKFDLYNATKIQADKNK